MSKIPAAFFSNESNPYFSRVGFVIIKSSTKLNILKSPLLELVTSNKPWKYFILKRLALCSARQSAPENQEKTILQPMIFFTRKYTERVSDVMFLLSCTHFPSSEFRRQLFVLQFFFGKSFASIETRRDGGGSSQKPVISILQWCYKTLRMRLTRDCEEHPCHFFMGVPGLWVLYCYCQFGIN